MKYEFISEQISTFCTSTGLNVLFPFPFCVMYVIGGSSEALTEQFRVLGELCVVQKQLLCVRPGGPVRDGRHGVQHPAQHLHVALPQRLSLLLQQCTQPQLRKHGSSMKGGFLQFEIKFITDRIVQLNLVNMNAI